jgi:hypothetical protein
MRHDEHLINVVFVRENTKTLLASFAYYRLAPRFELLSVISSIRSNLHGHDFKDTHPRDSVLVSDCIITLAICRAQDDINLARGRQLTRHHEVGPRDHVNLVLCRKSAALFEHAKMPPREKRKRKREKRRGTHVLVALRDIRRDVVDVQTGVEDSIDLRARGGQAGRHGVGVRVLAGLDLQRREGLEGQRRVAGREAGDELGRQREDGVEVQRRLIRLGEGLLFESGADCWLTVSHGDDLDQGMGTDELRTVRRVSCFDAQDGTGGG